MTDPQSPWVAEQPSVAPPQNPVFVQPPRTPRPKWLVPVIIGSVAFVVAIMVLAVFVLGAAFQNARQGPQQPLIEGEAASPHAVQPLDCATPCFTAAAVGEAQADAKSIVELGLGDTTFPWGTYEPVPVEELYRRDAAGWRSYDGTPDGCFFAPTSAPYASSLDDPLHTAPDQIHFIGTHEDHDRVDTFDQSVRVFADSATAEQFMTDLASSIAVCDELSIGPESDRYTARVTPAPQLSLPDSIAGVGWVRTGSPGPRWRAYIWDFQHGNIIVRTRLLTDGRVTEQEFRDFVESYARELDALPPSPSFD